MMGRMGRIAVSVIVASDRGGSDLEACLDSLAAQRGAPPFEVLVVSAQTPGERGDLLVGWVRMEERNAAARRNRAAGFAAGELLAFLDDDARATPDWLSRGFEASTRFEIFGGPDLLPPGSPFGERISDMLLATPVAGSAVAAHGRNPRPGPVAHPWDLTLCNLFVRRSAFDALSGFDESLGYIGEDTDFLRRAIGRGLRPVMIPELAVWHRRRAFPGAFLRQRWRYRFKTGRLLITRTGAYPRGRIGAFLLSAPAAGAALAVFGGGWLLPAAAAYAGAVWALSAGSWIRDPRLFPLAPFAFALHHANYGAATAAGALAGVFEAPAKPLSAPETKPPR